MDQVVAERDPRAEDLAEGLRHRPGEGGVLPADGLREQHDVLVIGEEDHALALE
jgi:hypothetical protein